MKGILAMAVGLVLVMLVASQYVGDVHPLDAAPTPTGSASSAPAAGAAKFASDGMTLERDPSGQFHVTASINGSQTRLLVDTGADSVALSVADAQAAGIDVNPNAFQPILRTASGQGWGTLVVLDRLELGTTELRNVGAVVVKDLDVSLLGQSVLARMGKVELQGDRMVIEPR